MGKRANDSERLAAVCEKQGFKIKRTRSGLMVLGKRVGDGMVEIHLTPSDWRSYQNTVARLRRLGVRL